MNEHALLADRRLDDNLGFETSMNIRAHRWSRSDIGKRAAVHLLGATAVAILVVGAGRVYAQSDDRSAAGASTLESVSPPSSGDWERVNGAPTDAPDDSSDNQVLEIPQVIDPNDAAAAQADAGGASSAAPSGDGGQQADGSSDGDGMDAPDQIGSINDYQSQQDQVGPAAAFMPPMEARPLGMSPPIGINPPLGMSPPVGYSPPIPMLAPSYLPPMGMYPGEALPPGGLMVPPGMNRYYGYMGHGGGYGAYIPPGAPGAPMFIVPRPMVSAPGGLWNRIHR